MTGLYIIIKYLTFPGAYIRAFNEHIVCRIHKLIVESRGYMRSDEASGHVEHFLAETKGSAAAIAFVPGIINFVAGLVMLIAGLMPVAAMGMGPSRTPVMFIAGVVFIYLGFSFLCNVYPLYEDALVLNDMIYGEDGADIVVKVLAFIPCKICLIGAKLDRYGVTFLVMAAITALAFFIL